MKINVLYEDNHIIVAIKPSGVLSQKDHSNSDDMLTIIKDYIKEKYNKPGNVYLGLVHRLDRNVGGVMVFAKTSKAASRLSTQIKNGDIDKCYHAVCHGVINSNGKLVDYIYKNEKLKKAIITNDKNRGKISKLTYNRISSKNDFSLVKILLETGRFHQIRCQFSNINHPLFGDVKYGDKGSKDFKFGLYATSLSFTHPVTKEKMKFETSLPNEIPWSYFN